MQAQQMQQAVSGGLPQLPAPNMARMAGGGIVGFQEGGSTSSDVEALIAQFIESGMDPVSAAKEAARALGITPEVPSTTYGTGDRTGQGENLMGVMSGVKDVVVGAPAAAAGLARRFAPQGMSEEELTALTTSEGAEPRPDSPGITDELKRRTGALKETLGRDLSFLSVFAPTQGFGVRPEPRNIFARGEPEAETASAAPDTESEMAPIGRLPTQELEQIEAEVESDPNAFQRLADWVVENPYDAVSMGLIAIPGIGLAGGLGMRGVSALMRSPAVRRAVQGLYSRPARGPRGSTLPVPYGARQFSPGSAMLTAGTSMTAAGQVANRMGGDGDGEGLASLPINSATPPADTSAVTPATTTQAPATPRNRISEEEAVAAISPSGPQTAAEYLMEYGQAPEEAPEAGESASDRAARMRRLIAGLRGFGAEGLGGFAAGTAEEELRAEQEMIAEQERQRRAAMETRGLDLQQQELTLMNQLRREDSENRRFDQIMSLVANFSQLDDNAQYRMGSAITEATKDLAYTLSMVNRALADPKTRGSDRESLEAQRAGIEQEMGDTVGRVTASFGESMDYRPIVESLLRSVMPAGMGATATTISPATLAALEQYGTQ
jgi:hypothetical protein